jgi:tetratricopeptide (TPR) repeat protein
MTDEGEIGLSRGDAFGLVSNLLVVGQLKRARDLATSLVADSPNDPVALTVLSRVLMNMNLMEQARAAAEEAARLEPDDDRVNAQLAFVALRQGRFRAAEEAILRALESAPDFAPYHLFYGRLLSVCDRDALALRAVEQALILDSDDSDAHELRAHLLLITRPNRWPISEDAALRALRLDPENAGAHAVLGVARLRAGRRQQAEDCFRRALRLEPNNRLAMRGLAETVMGQSLLYRPFLAYSVWMSRVQTGVQLAIVLGLWGLVSAATTVLAGKPSTAGLVPWLRYSYFAFCAYTWFATPVTRWILSRHYPWLREVKHV